MNKKFTQGPWRLIGSAEYGHGVQRGMSGGFMVRDDASQERSLADATLIAAAPEMLRALEFVLDRLDECSDPYILDTAEQIEAAIAKAYGIKND